MTRRRHTSPSPPLPPAPGDADNLSTMRISMMISARSVTITMIVEMNIQNPTTGLLGDHPGNRCASGHRKIPSPQHWYNESWWLIHLLCRRNPNILSIGRSISSWRRRMKASMHRWHPRRSPITQLNVWIRPLMSISTSGRSQTKPGSNWMNGKLDIWGDMSPLLTIWQA